MNTGVLCFDDSLIIEYLLFGLFRRRSWLGWSVRQRWKEAIILCFPGGQTFVYHSHSWVSFHVWLLRYVNLCGRSPGSYILEFGTYNINAMHPKTRKILQLLRLRQVLHETHPLWYYITVSGYYGFYLCFCLGHEGKYILLKG